MPTALEDLARKMGFDMIRLETGVRQPGVIALYLDDKLSPDRRLWRLRE
ncbi:MAG: hypothetical protein ACR2RA_01540 [Geminicoccaceae bacterium]